MDNFKNQLLAIERGDYTPEQLVSFFELIAQELELGSIKDISERLGISDRGARNSNRIRKIEIGRVLLATDKVKQSIFPF